ncbi:MAG: hypothetical protein ACOH1Q_11710 [Thiobacillus sp.]
MLTDKLSLVVHENWRLDLKSSFASLVSPCPTLTTLRIRMRLAMSFQVVIGMRIF